jgi:putative addiction module component (TIGR02574 family)
MPTTIKNFETRALELPAKDRARLAVHLIASLDSVDPGENEHLWAKEAERRYKTYKAGHMTARPAHDVFADIRKTFK